MSKVLSMEDRSHSIKIGSADHQSITLDTMRFVDTRMLIQANSGGGKSWLLRLLAEQVAGQIQTIILDPEGEFATLREQVDMLLVSREGDITTDTRSASLLARKLIELGASAVIDLYDLKLSERRHYVKLFIESLMSVPRSLWHPLVIILDEAHIFAPERSAGESEATEAVIALMSQGRKRGFCGAIATQRLSKLHKDVAAEANNVFIGRTWLDVDQKRAGELLGMGSSERQALRDLDAGQFYAFGPALSTKGVEVFKVDAVKTTHPKAGERHKIIPPKASSVVQSIVAHLADLPQQAEDELRTIADYKQRVVSLERELRNRIVKPVQPDERVIERAVNEATVRVERDMRAGILEQQKRIGILEGKLKKIAADAVFEPSQAIPIPARPLPTQPVRPAPIARVQPIRQVVNNGHLPIGEKKILTALAQYPDGCTREQLSVLTGYKRSSRDAYIQRLRERGYADSVGSSVVPTNEGINALGSDFEPLPTGIELQEYWLARLPEGERKVLQALVAAYPSAVDRDEIDSATGYKRSSRDAYIQRLKARQLVEIVGRGEVRATSQLFN